MDKWVGLVGAEFESFYPRTYIHRYCSETLIFMVYFTSSHLHKSPCLDNGSNIERLMAIKDIQESRGCLEVATSACKDQLTAYHGSTQSTLITESLPSLLS